jgi:hypothetical protein
MAVFNFNAYKSLGEDGILPVLLQEAIIDLVTKYFELVLLLVMFHYPGGQS